MDPARRPKDLPPEEPLKPFVPPPVIAKTLPNGMTVWLVLRPGFPKVAFALTVRGSLVNDPEAMPGLSQMLAATLTLGTKDRTAKQIAERMMAAIDTDFGKWTASGRAGLSTNTQPTPHVSHDIFVVDRPGSVQTVVILGYIAPTGRNRDYPAFEVANMLYGGMFSARLDANLREEKGYTYGAGTEYQT